MIAVFVPVIQLDDASQNMLLSNLVCVLPGLNSMTNWVICMFLSSADFSRKISGISSECQIAWIQIRLDKTSGSKLFANVISRRHFFLVFFVPFFLFQNFEISTSLHNEPIDRLYVRRKAYLA